MSSHYSVKVDQSMYNVEEVAELLRGSLEDESELNISRFNVWSAYDGDGYLSHWIAYSDCYEAALFSIPRSLRDEYNYTLSFYYKNCDISDSINDEILFVRIVGGIDGITLKKEF